MSLQASYLHSHSALERELRFPKHVVLVDEKFRDMFNPDTTKDFIVGSGTERKVYLKVPILEFVKKGGVFKNFME